MNIFWQIRMFFWGISWVFIQNDWNTFWILGGFLIINMWLFLLDGLLYQDAGLRGMWIRKTYLGGVQGYVFPVVQQQGNPVRQLRHEFTRLCCVSCSGGLHRPSDLFVGTKPYPKRNCTCLPERVVLRGKKKPTRKGKRPTIFFCTHSLGICAEVLWYSCLCLFICFLK